MDNADNELLERLKRHAEANGIDLNPNQKVVDGVVKALERRKERLGDHYCPCRVYHPDTAKDIVCPCKFHLDEIKADGQCHCRLFVGK